MKEFTLSNIDTSFSCYNKFATLYKELKDVDFDTINIHLEGGGALTNDADFAAAGIDILSANKRLR